MIEDFITPFVYAIIPQEKEVELVLQHGYLNCTLFMEGGGEFFLQMTAMDWVKSIPFEFRGITGTALGYSITDDEGKVVRQENFSAPYHLKRHDRISIQRREGR